MTELDESIKLFCSGYVNGELANNCAAIAIRNEQIVYDIMQLTGKSRKRIINHVLVSVISFQDTLQYAEIYRKFPNDWACEEIFMMGFDNWIRFERL